MNTQDDSQPIEAQKDAGPADSAGEGAAPGEALASAAGDGAVLDPAAERDLWQGRTSWKHSADLLALGLGWTVAAAVIGFARGGWIGWVMFTLTMLGWAYVLSRMFYGMLKYHYRLTNQRLFIERGILGKTIDQTELIRVDDVSIRKNFFERLMGLGSIDILSTDMSDRKLTITGIVEPEKIADHIRQNMRTLRRKSLFVEHL